MSGADQHRYLAALPRGDEQVFLSWRLLDGDRPDVGFHVERRPASGGAWTRVTPETVVDSTGFLDRTPRPGAWAYRVVSTDGSASEAATVDSAAPPTPVAIDVPLNPDDLVEGNAVALGDLRNDGRIGYVVRSVRRGTIWISAFAHDGAALWETDTYLPGAGGWNGSALHVPVLCWDVNTDGRTEVVFRRDKIPSGATRHEATGPNETMVALDAETGQVVWERPWPGRRPREMMTVGHLRGLDALAAVVHQDETYGPVVLTAVDGATGDILWRVEQDRPGGHNLDVGDIYGDGAQEVICGGICYNGDGSVRWQAEPFGHTDISKPARIDPAREGLQIWYAVESDNPGVYLVDYRGRTIFKEAFRHAHYGWVARHTASVPGLQPHTAEDARHEYGAADAGARREGHFPIFLPDGSHWLNLTEWQRKNLVPVHWDAGPEVVFIVRKDDKRIVRLLPTGQIEDVPEGGLPAGGRYGRNLACADVVGDFRENIVAIDGECHRLMVLANPTPCAVRGYSPWADFEYRHDRSQHGSGYYIYLSPPDTAVNRRA